MNKFLATGRLCDDVEVKNINGKTLGLWSLAVDRPYGGENKETDFFKCQAWGKTAEIASEYLHKGSKILVDGRIQIRGYEDKDGQKKYVTEVVVERFEFLDTKKKETQDDDDGWGQFR